MPKNIFPDVPGSMVRIGTAIARLSSINLFHTSIESTDIYHIIVHRIDIIMLQAQVVTNLLAFSNKTFSTRLHSILQLQRVSHVSFQWRQHNVTRTA